MTFEDKIEEFFKEFHKDFSSWVKDFVNLTKRRDIAASINNRFLENRAKSLIRQYDSLIETYTGIFWRIMSEFAEITSAEKKCIIDKKRESFYTLFSTDIINMQESAKNLLDDVTEKKIHLSITVQRQIIEIRDTDFKTLLEKITE